MYAHVDLFAVTNESGKVATLIEISKMNGWSNSMDFEHFDL